MNVLDGWYSSVENNLGMTEQPNVDERTVNGFGSEWTRFDQSEMPSEELEELFNGYFSIFPWASLPRDAEGFDLGCGSGRWAKLVAPRVGRLHCIDPSSALQIAEKNLATLPNCVFHRATVDAIPLEDSSMDFGYSLGVLHHVPKTEAGIEACVRKLKPGAPFLVYLYYALDSRPWWYRGIWRVTDLARSVISHLPYRARYLCTQAIALIIYLPLARLAGGLEKTGLKVGNLPLSAYRGRTFYTMRTDALDRFGTPLEKRFTRRQIHEIMHRSGLERIEFSEQEPFWCAVGYRSDLSVSAR